MSNEKLIPELRFPEFKQGEDWTVKKLGLLTNTTIGEFVIKTKQDPNSPYPVYNGGISYTGFYGEYNNEANKIVISARGANAGFVNLVKQKYWAGNSCYSVEVLNKNEIDLELLFYYIKHNQRRFTDNQQAANIPSVSKGDVEKFQICYPDDIKEQKKIAICLSSLDEVISANSQKLDLLKDHKKGLMQNLFPQEGEKVPKYRFKEFEKDGEWVEKKLGEVAEIITGNTPSTTETAYYGGDKMFVSPADINDNRIVSKTKSTLTQLGFSKTRQIKAGSVLFVCIGSTIGKIAQNKYECATNQQLNSLIANTGYSNDFLYSLLDGNSTGIASIAGNHAVPIINKTSFSDVKLYFPPSFQEQQKIAPCLCSLDELITSQAEIIALLKLHKKGLMQGLFPKIND